MRRKKWIAVGLTLGALMALMALSVAMLGASGPGEEVVADDPATEATSEPETEVTVTDGPTTAATIKNPDAPPAATVEPVEVDVHCEVAADGSWGHCNGYIDPAMIPTTYPDKD